MSRTPEQIVAAEVHYCVSSLVSIVAEGVGYMIERRGEPITELAYQAAELCSPIDDWEEAAAQSGVDWAKQPNGKIRVMNAPDGSDMIGTEYDDTRYAAIAWCDWYSVEPYQREVFEHWIVSDWLAEQLAERGEKVDTDFAGMTVWARTTTGQGIASDSVIEAIAADMAKRYGGNS